MSEVFDKATELSNLMTFLRSLPPPDQIPIPRRREVSDLAAKLYLLPADTSIVPWEFGTLDGEILKPANASDDRWILYLHGGGYVAGSALSHRHLAGALAAASGSRALVINYRLAPEHVFPAALDDAATALGWLYTQTSPGKIVIAGDSAGGSLVIATAMDARNKRLALPAALISFSPWADLTCPTASIGSDDPMVVGSDMLEIAKAYLGKANPENPLASPVFGDFRNLPPLLIQVSGAERIYEDSVRLANGARAANVAVTLEIVPDVPHVWQWFWPRLELGREAVDRAGAFIVSEVNKIAAVRISAAVPREMK